MMKRRPQVSVVVVNWNAGELLIRCLKSIYEQGIDDLEIVLVDNASTDGSARIAKEHFPAIKLIQMERNEGYAVGCNVGVREACGEFILLLNPDVILLPHCLSRLLEFASTNPQAGAVAPKLLNPEGSLQPSVRGFPYPFSLLSLPFSYLFPQNRLLARYRMTFFDYDKLAEVEQPMSSCLLVRRVAYEELGGMDENFPLYFNDVDFLYRMKKKGWKIFFLPQARAVHFLGVSTSLLRNISRLWLSYKGLLGFYRKHFPLWLPLAYIFLLTLPIRAVLPKRRKKHFLVFQPIEEYRGGPRLSVIVVNWNAGEYLPRCLSSIYNEGMDVEVILVDNASTDRSEREAKKRFPQIKLIQMGENKGYSAACNAGIKVATGQFILILNPDTEVLPGAFEKLLNFALEHPEAGIIGPQLIGFDGKVQMSCRRFPKYETGLFRGTFLERLMPKSRTLSRYLLSGWDHSTPRAVDWVSGAAMLLRREFLKEVGLFDETFYMYCEDVDMGMRAREFGWKVMYCPYARIKHRIGGSSDKKVIPMLVKFHLSHYLFFKKHWGWRTSLFGELFLIFGLVARTILLILKNRWDIFLNMIKGKR
ncbi:glycosyltransferase [bacterium]|nr:glycosyltransferase [bacterium]